MMSAVSARALNDPGQYDDLAADWWEPDGVFAMLHWLARSRAEHLPPPLGPGGILVDVACGGGLLAPYTSGYLHIGVDIGVEATRIASEHGVRAVRGDAARLPLPDSCADVVVAGEVLEHVADLTQVVAEVCRVLRPGGTVLVDTIARTRLAVLIAVTIAERVPGGPPKGLHDPALFVNRKELIEEFAKHGVQLRIWGLRPSVPGLLRWLSTRHRGDAVPVRMLVVRPTAVLFQGLGVKVGS